jgi:hypothetical protein
MSDLLAQASRSAILGARPLRPGSSRLGRDPRFATLPSQDGLAGSGAHAGNDLGAEAVARNSCVIRTL